MPLRLFIAVTPPEEVRSHLGRVQAKLREWRPPVSLRLAANLHATLKFLGDVEEARLPALTEALARLEPWKAFDLNASGVVCFGRPTRVIAAALADESHGLGRLYERVEAACAALGFAPEDRVPVPHVTLGRIPRPLCVLTPEIEDVTRPLWPGPGFAVREFALVRSTLKPGGAEYRTLATFAAAAPPDLPDAPAGGDNNP